MESTVGSRNPDHNQASAKSSKGPRLYQLGMTSAVSPSMMSSGGPSSENTSAFASNQWDTGVHHSTSTPQIYSGNLDEMSGQMSNKYLSRQSTLSGSSDTAALGTSGGGQPNANKVSQVVRVAVRYADPWCSQRVLARTSSARRIWHIFLSIAMEALAAS